MAARIASTALAFTGLPANAPFRSTTCNHSKPCSSKLRACTAGSSLNTVTWSISPCRSRTHWPSLRSMAGNRIMCIPSPKKGEGGKSIVEPRVACWWSGRLRNCSPRSRPFPFHSDRKRERVSRFPSQEIGDEREPELLALLGVKLGAGHVVSGDEGRDRTAVVRARDQRVVVLRHEVEGVHEIGMQA